MKSKSTPRFALRCPKTRTRTAVACISLAIILAIGTAAWAGPFDKQTKLTASDASEDDTFGWSVGIDGNTAIVGKNFGEEALLFNATTGNELFKLTALDSTRNDRFGQSVGIDGNTAIVGAFFDTTVRSQEGSAYLFDVDTGTQRWKLTARDAAPNDNFGFSVGVSGSTAIVGGRNGSPAYLFDVNTGNQLRKLEPSDASGGQSVAISGNRAIVGNSNKGAA